MASSMDLPEAAGMDEPASPMAPSSPRSPAKNVPKAVVDNPTFDLEGYIQKYEGYTKLARLVFIAERCPTIAPDAYRLCLQELKQGVNTTMYEDISQKVGDSLGPDFSYDKAWVENVEKKSKQKLDRLQQELQSYKQNLVKENIRMGHNDLGLFYYQRGDLPSALKSFIRTRDYCTTSKHILEMCLHVITIAVHLGNYNHVLNYVAKAEQSVPATESLDKIVAAKLRCCSALALLESEKYEAAANSFIEVSYDIGNDFNQVIHAEDIGIYGGFCALATFSREDLRSKIIENQQFKQFLELVPKVRELVLDFFNSRYAACFANIERMKNDLELDIHLYKHMPFLIGEIRNRALIQYFSPYLSVDLRSMAAAFSTAEEELEKELSALIRAKRVAGRIDRHKKVLLARHADQRSAVFEKTFEVGRTYIRDTKALLLRVDLLKNDFVVRQGNKAGGGGRMRHGGVGWGGSYHGGERRERLAGAPSSHLNTLSSEPPRSPPTSSARENPSCPMQAGD